mmetsp:Transcript_138566/g.430951  ORF Transcript_138566/g.430951 Transcript_138566/m.430951 type:complete len:240 (-) Transcript_138566:85-804(-)
MGQVQRHVRLRAARPPAARQRRGQKLWACLQGSAPGGWPLRGRPLRRHPGLGQAVHLGHLAGLGLLRQVWGPAEALPAHPPNARGWGAAVPAAGLGGDGAVPPLLRQQHVLHLGRLEGRRLLRHLRGRQHEAGATPRRLGHPSEDDPPVRGGTGAAAAGGGCRGGAAWRRRRRPRGRLPRPRGRLPPHARGPVVVAQGGRAGVGRPRCGAPEGLRPRRQRGGGAALPAAGAWAGRVDAS